ncbi:PREDICTED: major facilitator superfamily domain-containing protein 7-a-like [Amphimedon queenslandica]|nr:PREDICTED: major facilitator superfamily domain-containing protein 7-a-like [Amphimedon queenslandica]|eukprot:XP_003383915.1 PREDICTED: major facilitator superfamily domain-containing protein 7-a-like [Amphimedon queenslandica]
MADQQEKETRGYHNNQEIIQLEGPTETAPLVIEASESIGNNMAASGDESKVQLENKTQNISTGSNGSFGPPPQYEPHAQYKLYPIRYLMLVALMVLNLSNGIMWLSYSPVPSLTASYYGVGLSEVDWFSNSYFIASLIVGFFSIFVLDVFGLRTAVIIGTVCNLLGAVLRYLSTIDPIICSDSKAGFITAIIGQVITAFAQPFFLYAPAKLANTWFGAKERGLCTDLASVANPLGIAVAQIVSPYIVTDVQKLPTMLWVYIIPAGVGALLSFSFIYRSSPPIPPTASGDTPNLPFVKGLKSAFKNVNFWVLLTTYGVGAGVFNAVLIIIPQYVCPYGYSNKAAGLWGSLLIIFGVIGATLSGLLISRTRLYKEIGMICLSCTILTLIGFVEVSTIEHIPVALAVLLSVTGFFAIGFLPVAMELGVEVTFPAAEATSSGLLWSSAQIFGFLFVTVGQLISPVIDSNTLSYNECQVSLPNSNETMSLCDGRRSNYTLTDNAKPQNWTNCGLLLVGMATFAFLVFVLFFRRDYKRTQYEEKIKNGEAGTNNN